MKSWLRLLVIGALVAGAIAAAAPAALAFSPPQIYWANLGTNSIEQANIDGTPSNQSPIAGANEPTGVAVNGQRIFWANSNGASIGESNLDGTVVTPNLIGADSPSAVAVDGQHIYWTSLDTNSIGEATLDGTVINAQLITGADEPQGIAVDGNHIYWANQAGNTIGEANLDGSDPNESFITAASAPVGIAVDGRHIYWTNAGTNTIGEANLDGGDANPSLVTGARHPLGVAVDDQHLYWTNFDSGAIGSANLDGTAVTQTLITGANLPWGIAVSVPVAQLSPASPPAFPTTPQGTLSTPQTVTVTNGGQRDLVLTGLSLAGADPGDFVVTSDGCQGPVAPDESCQLTVAFAPQGQGTRTATLMIASNDVADSPLGVALTGTGGGLPAGPIGPQGPAGPRGPAGPPGQVVVIICLTRDCVVHVLGGTVHLPSSDTADRATISRGHRVYATGTRIALRHGRSEFVLSASRRLPRGRYTLTVRVRHGRSWTTERIAITVRAR